MVKGSATLPARLAWFLAAAFEIAAIIVDFAETRHIKLIYVGPALFCLGMALFQGRGKKENGA